MLNPLKNMLCLEVNSVFKHHSRLQVQYPSDKETTVRDFLGEKNVKLNEKSIENRA